MADYAHMWTRYEHDADCDARTWVLGLAQWAEHFEQMQPEFPTPITKSVYAEGSVSGRLPAVRELHVDTARLPDEMKGMMPDKFVESLDFADAETLSGMFRIVGEPMGMRNYHAFMEAVETGPDTCRVTITSRWDVPSEVPEEALKPLFHEAYRVMINGVAAHGKTLSAPA